VSRSTPMGAPATSLKVAQHSPPNPTTPLPAHKLAAILGGDASIGDNGVVTVTVTRKTSVLLGGIRIKPELGVSRAVMYRSGTGPAGRNASGAGPSEQWVDRHVGEIDGPYFRSGGRRGQFDNRVPAADFGLVGAVVEHLLVEE
jgi:hypothetical protein